MKYVITKQTIADTRFQLIKDEPDALAVNVLFNLLVDSLALHERKAYRFVRDNPSCTSKQARRELEIQQNHVGNIMKRLLGYGLAEGETVTGEGSIYYRWTAITHG